MLRRLFIAIRHINRTLQPWRHRMVEAMAVQHLGIGTFIAILRIGLAVSNGMDGQICLS